MSARIRLAVVGLAQGLEDIYVALKNPDFEVAALCDLDRRRYDWITGRECFETSGSDLLINAHYTAMMKEVREHPAIQQAVYHDSLESLLQRDDIDAVSLVLPPQHHADAAIQTLAAGKAVLSSKPFADTYVNARRLWEVARQHSTRFMVGFQYSYTKLSRKVAEVLASGKIGPLRQIDLHYHRGQFREINRQRSRSGGSLHEEGCHFLDLIQRYNAGGRFTEVMADGGLDKLRETQDIDDNGMVLIRFDNGVRATFAYSYFGSFKRHFSLFIQGEKGQMEGDFNHLTVSTENGATERFELNDREEYPLINHPGYGYLMEAFGKMIREGKPAPTSPDQGFQVFCLTLAAQAALDTKRNYRPEDLEAHFS